MNIGKNSLADDNDYCQIILEDQLTQWFSYTTNIQ